MMKSTTLAGGSTPGRHGALSHRFSLLAARFVEWMSALNFSPKTCLNYGHDLREFLTWLSLNVLITSIAEVTPSHLQQYQIDLYNGDLQIGKIPSPLSALTQKGRLVAIRKFFSWLLSTQQIAYSPAASLSMPKTPWTLPRNILSPEEVQRLIETPPMTTSKGLRDRTILTIFYRTGIRRAELLSLKLYDLDLSMGTLTIRQGKGKRDRVVPLLDGTVSLLKVYLSDVRPILIGKAIDFLFVSIHSGGHLTGSDIRRMVTKAAQDAGITKPVTPHALRHACATHLLKGQADIRQIQKLLGHRRLSSTEVYTHVETSDLREVLKRCHPRES